jgi:hypothetical protein
MSLIPTYAIPDNLPPPVASGTTIQSFTDTWGDVWIAKSGVYGGAWKRARDTLIGKWYRSAALTIAGTVAIPFDVTVRDPYGMYTNPAASALGIPITGLYDITWQYSVVATAAGQWIAPRVYVNSWLQGVTQPHSSSANNFSALICQQLPLYAGDSVQFLAGNSVSLAVAVGAPGFWTYATVEYYGTG